MTLRKCSVLFASLLIGMVMAWPVLAANVLFVTAQPDASQGDDPFVLDHLIDDLGHNVETQSGDGSSSGDEDGFDLVIVSSTLGSGSIRGKLAETETPLLHWEEALARWEHGNADGNWRFSEFSKNGGGLETDTIVIVNPDHCLAAGLSGVVVFAEEFGRRPFSHGELAPGVIQIAELSDDVAQEEPAEAVILAIETGGILGPDAAGDELPSPGPVVYFPIEDGGSGGNRGGFSFLTEEGVALFDASVEWLLNGGVCGEAGPPPLQAGDSDQDLDFDQLDLVQVQIAAKYLTGQAATWGQGDWNGAPGGEVGSPPAGNGLFDQLDIIAALSGGKYLIGPYAALSGPGTAGDGQTSVGYNVNTGEVFVDAPAGTDLTSINIDSAAGIFTGDAAQNLGGSFDNDADNNIFKATFGSSFGSLSFGNVAQPGLSQDVVMNDLTVVGSLAGGGDLGNVDLIYVPEPSTFVLVGFGLAAFMGLARRRQTA